jgi:hypothetical protein
MSISELYRAARSLEAVENYSVAGIPADHSSTLSTKSQFSKKFRNEEEFWGNAFSGRIPWSQKVQLFGCALSEWVPRIPGLFWTKQASVIRTQADAAVESVSENWTVLKPLGKSQKVMGGIGTLRFPPDLYGYRLVSVTGALNASTGIPVLISHDVWEYHHLEEGIVVDRLEGNWQSMAGTSWAERFPSTRGIPKGFIVLTNPDQLNLAKLSTTVAIQFHPFSVMEYSLGNATLFDFVYATADSGEIKHRQYVEKFFEEYKNSKNRFGRFLLSSDMIDPLWEAMFESPESLHRAEPGARSQMELLTERVRSNTFRGRNLDEIIQFLAQNYRTEDLRPVSFDIEIPTAIWDSGGSSAHSAVNFLAECVKRKKVEELIDRIGIGADLTLITS